ncbi:hypothetical protein FKP32DRAFT_1587656 [Trametes sanguinea]|nr:hypothetical protein FKP32DRAFT_1587656 [Trametes sanguinea]
MGKWTLEHHDEVLRNKMKNMVQGAVKRMNTEKESSSISYEAFVEELDEGDSFTTGLIDVLVKEMAERRTRPNPIDRRLISERTAKALRMQAAPLHIYRGPSSLSHRSRRGVPVLPPRSYSTFRDLLSESEGEDEYGTVISTSGPLEGVRLNAELYDAYFPSTDDLPGSLSRRPDPLPPPAPAGSTATNGPAWLMGPRSQSPPSARSIWPTSTGDMGQSSTRSFLSRQPSIRRPYQLRATDFDDFTARRRSAIRNNHTQEDDVRAEPSAETTDRTSTPGGSHIVDSSAQDTTPYSPFMSWPRARSRSIPSRSSTAAARAQSRSGATQDPPATASGNRSPSSSQLWYSLTSTIQSAPPPQESTAVSVSTLPPVSRDGASDGERPQVVAPRLRRGGLRPPESLLTQQAADSASPPAASPQGEPAQNPTPTSVETVPTDNTPPSHSDTASLSSVLAPASNPGSPPVPVESRFAAWF